MLFGFSALFLPLESLEAVGRLFGGYAILEGALVALIALALRMRRARERGNSRVP